MVFMGLGRFRRSTLCRQLGDKVYALMDQLRQHQADLSDLDFFFEQFLVATVFSGKSYGKHGKPMS